jgi:hypothetical protein
LAKPREGSVTIDQPLAGAAQLDQHRILVARYRSERGGLVGVLVGADAMVGSIALMLGRSSSPTSG